MHPKFDLMRSVLIDRLKLQEMKTWVKKSTRIWNHTPFLYQLQVRINRLNTNIDETDAVSCRYVKVRPVFQASVSRHAVEKQHRVQVVSECDQRLVIAAVSHVFNLPTCLEMPVIRRKPGSQSRFSAASNSGKERMKVLVSPRTISVTICWKGVQ